MTIRNITIYKWKEMAGAAAETAAIEAVKIFSKAFIIHFVLSPLFPID
jgi:hypothetical protein